MSPKHTESPRNNRVEREKSDQDKSEFYLKNSTHFIFCSLKCLFLSYFA